MTKYTQFMKKHLLSGLSMKQAAAQWQKHKKSASPKRSGAKRSAKRSVAKRSVAKRSTKRRSVAKRSGAKRSANKNIDLLKQVLRSVSPPRKQKKQSLNAIVKKLLKATSPKKRSAKKRSAKKRSAKKSGAGAPSYSLTGVPYTSDKKREEQRRLLAKTTDFAERSLASSSEDEDS